MNQTDKARRFAELHVKGAPVLLYNTTVTTTMSSPAISHVCSISG